MARWDLLVQIQSTKFSYVNQQSVGFTGNGVSLKWFDWVCSPVRVAGKSLLLGEPVPPGSSGDF
ncbi:hypothetical protein CUMW_052830 [Citrus unshiu]|nr:hypothetical protein CUMW_052830 [Citrus unshiu]